jgi:hypothetical protein
MQLATGAFDWFSTLRVYVLCDVLTTVDMCHQAFLSVTDYYQICAGTSFKSVNAWLILPQDQFHQYPFSCGIYYVQTKQNTATINR